MNCKCVGPETAHEDPRAVPEGQQRLFLYLTSLLHGASHLAAPIADSKIAVEKLWVASIEVITKFPPSMGFMQELAM